MSEEVRFPFKRDQLEKWINVADKEELLILERDGEPIGFSITSIDDDTATLLALAIKKSERNKGFGSFFFSEMLKMMKKKGIKKFILFVHKTNKKAIAFYEKFGFKKAIEVIPMYKGKWK